MMPKIKNEDKNNGRASVESKDTIEGIKADIREQVGVHTGYLISRFGNSLIAFPKDTIAFMQPIVDGDVKFALDDIHTEIEEHIKGARSVYIDGLTSMDETGFQVNGNVMTSYNAYGTGYAAPVIESSMTPPFEGSRTGFAGSGNAEHSRSEQLLRDAMLRSVSPYRSSVTRAANESNNAVNALLYGNTPIAPRYAESNTVPRPTAVMSNNVRRLYERLVGITNEQPTNV